ncbi:two-component sensor histidine kinase [Mucilaginibacter sp. UYP25]|uniref:tetratricopeptide repeat-containing sensor histidine kinase n=1 Tax=unclassified Mucilaginibacter TaxID=2617802 RepID=UPI0033943CE8
MLKKILSLFCMIVFFFSSATVQGQTEKLNPEQNQLLLQLSLNYYTVVKEGRIDQDSSLLIVCRKNRLSRWPVITENFGKYTSLAKDKWIDKQQPGGITNKLGSLMGMSYLKQLVLVGAYYAFQPGYHQKDRDNATYYLSKAKQESETNHSMFWLNQTLCLLGKNHFKANRIKEGIDCFQTVIRNCQKAGDKEMEAKSWDYQGTYCPPTAATIMLKINSINKANDLYQQINQPAKQINALMNLAYLNFLMNDIKGSEAKASKALRLQNELNFPYLHYTYDLLSLISSQKTKVERGLDFELKAVKSALATKDSLGLVYFYARIGHTIYGSDKTYFSFSDYWLKKAAILFLDNRDPDIYLTIYNLTANQLESGKPNGSSALLENALKNIPAVELIEKQFAFLAKATNYESLKNYREAEKYYLLVYKMMNEGQLVTKDLRASYYKYIIGRFYFKASRYDKSKRFLEEYLASAGPKTDNLIVAADVQTYLYKIDSLQGHFESAANHLQQYITFDKQLTDSNDNKNIAGMKIQLEITQKERDLQVLKAKNTLQSQQANATRNFIYVGIAVALLIIGMLYGRYFVNKKQKQEMDKKNCLLQSVISEKDELLVSKEWLLKEVHHRVKNNLHTVICLLESQAQYLQNDALMAIENSQHRIYSMSLIHQKLYQSEDIKTVDMSLYLPEFVSYLTESFGTGNRIRFDLDIQPIKLGVSYAVPLSLIVNEAVTNSIKYAFPGNRNGQIKIQIHEVENEIMLMIADNGIGINMHEINASPASLGLKLLRGLSEDIKADFSLVNDNGTVINIKFKVEQMMYDHIT